MQTEDEHCTTRHQTLPDKRGFLDNLLKVLGKGSSSVKLYCVGSSN